MDISLGTGCTFLAIKGGGAYDAVTVYQNDFQTPLWTGFLNQFGAMSVDSFDLGMGAGIQLTGIFVIETGGETAAICAPCDVMCCLAKKMDAYVDKSCKCEQCDKDLDLMYKIFLLLHTAQVSTSLLDNLEIHAALKKYNKAMELCSLGTCKCNC